MAAIERNTSEVIDPQETIITLKAEVESLVKENTELKNEISALRGRYQISEQVKEKSSIMFKELEMRLREAEVEKASLGELVKSVTPEVNSLRKKLAEVHTNLFSARTENRHSKQRHTELETKLSESIRQNQLLTRQVENRVSGNEDENRRLTERVTSLEEDLADAHEQNTYLMGHQRVLESERKNYEAVLGVAWNQLIRMHRRKSRFSRRHRDKIVTLEACLATLHQDIESRTRFRMSQRRHRRRKEEKCVICLDRESCIETQPCMHVVMCHLCAPIQYGENGTCPIDRSRIGSMRNV